MNNTIPDRIADFLKEFPPFNLLDKQLLRQMAGQATVQYRRPGEFIFRQGESSGQHIYVVREGAVHLFREEAGTEILMEICDEGDVFGIRPMLAKDEYALTARVEEETLLYAIPTEKFAENLRQNPQIALYLASNLATGAARNYQRLHLVSQTIPVQDSLSLIETQPIGRGKKPVVCSPDTDIRTAAGIMSRQQVGSILIVDPENRPLGIMTDKDLRHKVATGEKPLTAPVSDIMSSPVITCPTTITMAEVQMEMVRRRIHHLCLTTDGTDQTPVEGVISEHDLLVLQGNNPAVLIREIRRSKDAVDLHQIRDRAEDLLRKYLDQELGMTYIASIISEINDALIERVLELALAEMEHEDHPTPNVRFCWLSLGSEGRGEQLLRTDQDNALVFDSVSEDEYAQTKQYYLLLAGKANRMLADCGFEKCPADMMAGNPRWCLSVEEWKKQFSAWIFEPTPQAIMHCTIFFDFRAVFGKGELAGALADHIAESVRQQPVFLGFLAKNALQNPPPLTFFRNFMVEHSGEHKDEFDVKARAMMPLADAARVLALNNHIPAGTNTAKRFKTLAEQEPQNRELFELAVDAYEILMRYRAVQGLKNKDSGRFFNPAHLSKMERLNLRNSFQPVKELQSLLRIRFRTDDIQG